MGNVTTGEWCDPASKIAHHMMIDEGGCLGRGLGTIALDSYINRGHIYIYINIL